VRQLVETIAPGAPKSVRNALQAAAERGEHLAVEVVSASWRAGLLQNPDRIVELLGHARVPFRAVPDSRLEGLLRGLAESGRSVDAVQLVSSIIDGGVMLDAGARRLLAEDNNTVAAVLEALAGDTSVAVRERVASNPNVPPETLRRLAQDADEDVRRSVALNRATTADILEALSRDDDSIVRHRVARNSRTEPRVLTALAGDSDPMVREWVARNPNTEAGALEALARDTEIDVRLRVATHPNTEAGALEALARDEAFSVRMQVAARSTLSGETLELLAQDGDAKVRESVGMNPTTQAALLEELARDEDSAVRRGVATNPNTEARVLEELVQEEDLRRFVAGNASTPTGLLEELSRDEDSAVRLAVAGNPRTTVACLAELSTDVVHRVQMTVGANLSTPANLLRPLSAIPHVRWRLLEDPDTPADLLEKFAASHSVEELRVLAKNPSAPALVLERLAVLEGEQAEQAEQEARKAEQEQRGALRNGRGEYHDDWYEYQAILSGAPVELCAAADLAYDALVRYGAPPTDHSETIGDVRELGRENQQFRFSDDTVGLRHRLHGSVVEMDDTALVPRVLSSRRALTENANYMGNCTAGYEEYIRQGDTLLVTLDDTTDGRRTTRYNVEILRGESGRWDVIEEINSRFNEGVTKAERAAITAQLTELLTFG
jgi:hypothetical protein